MQTEFHHLRTLKIMSDVYSRGMMADLLFEQQMVEKLFPCLDELIGIHSQFFQRILERKKDSLVDKSEKNFLIRRIGDVLVQQVSGSRAPRTSRSHTHTHTHGQTHTPKLTHTDRQTDTRPHRGLVALCAPPGRTACDPCELGQVVPCLQPSVFLF